MKNRISCLSSGPCMLFSFVPRRLIIGSKTLAAVKTKAISMRAWLNTTVTRVGLHVRDVRRTGTNSGVSCVQHQQPEEGRRRRRSDGGKATQRKRRLYRLRAGMKAPVSHWRCCLSTKSPTEKSDLSRR